MANITRIKNNQITDATITFAKIASGTLTGALFNPALTLNSNVTILGNLSVTGNTSTINSTNTFVNDPLIVFNNGYTGSPTYDIGMIANRNLQNLAGYGSVNTAFVWKETDASFQAIATTETGTTTGSITNSGWANVKVGNLTALTTTTGGLQAVAIGNITPGSGAFTTGTFSSTLDVTGATTLTTATAGGLQVVAIGNVTPGTGVFTTGTFNTATAGGLQAVAIGNVAPGTGVFTTATAGSFQGIVGNAAATTAFFTTANATNIYAATIGNASTSLNGSIATITNWANITGTTAATSTTTGALIVAGGVGVTGNIYSGYTLTAANIVTSGSNGNISGVSNLFTANVIATNVNAVTIGNTGAAITGNTGTLTSLQAVAIGNVTPGTGAFTTATAGGLQAVAIGNVTPGSGAFTTATAGSFQGIIGNATATTAFFTTANATTVNAATIGNIGAVLKGDGGLISNISLGAIGGTFPTANVAMYENIATTTTNAVYYAYLADKASGNVAAVVATGVNVNPSTSTVSALAFVGGTGAFTTLSASGATTVTDATQSTSSGTGALVVTGGAGIGANLYVGGNTTIIGNLTVVGTTTAVQSTTLDVSDLNITVAKGASTAAAANGAGLTVDGAGATLTYLNATDTWNINKGLVGTTITTGGLQAQAIGNVTPGTYVFTTGSVGGLQAVAIGNVTPGSGAFTTGTFSSTLGVTGATTMTTATTGGLQAVAIGNATPGTGVFTTGTFNTATTGGLQAVAIGNVTAGTGAFTTLSASTWANITGTTAATSTTTGALVVAGGAGIAGALHVGSTATITGNTAVNNTLYGRGVYDNGVQVVSTSTGAGNLTISAGGINLTATGPGAVTTGDASSIPVITTDAYGRITSISTATVASTAGAANVSFHTQTVALNNNATFFPTFSNVNGGNSIPGTSSLLTYNASTGNLVSQLGFVSSSQASTSTTSGALQVAGGAGIGGNVHVGGSISATNEITSTKNEEATSTTTGAIRATGGIATQANLFVGKAATFNSSQTAGMDFVVRGKTDTTLIWARPSASYDTVIIGNSAVAGDVVAGAKLNINTTDSIKIPVGTNAQRPGNQGQTDVQGMFRYSTTQNAIEWYTGTEWNAATTQFTTIVAESFNGDGSTVDFTLSAATTTASTIVSINGIVQIPTLAYSIVTGTTLRFTEAPASGDIIDVRRLTTTTSVTHIDDATGYNAVDVDNVDGVTISTGTAAKNNRYRINTDGAQVSLLANTAIASANVATTIDTMATGTYRSAKYTVQATNGTSYQVLEALLISNGTTATVMAYGTIQTAGNLGVVTATQSGSNALLQFVALSSSTNVRITKEYLLI